jgi:hypothetical protein
MYGTNVEPDPALNVMPQGLSLHTAAVPDIACRSGQLLSLALLTRAEGQEAWRPPALTAALLVM